MSLPCPWKLLIHVYLFSRSVQVLEQGNTSHWRHITPQCIVIWTDQSTCQYTLPLHIKCHPNRCIPTPICSHLKRWASPTGHLTVTLYVRGWCSSTTSPYGKGRYTCNGKGWYEPTQKRYRVWQSRTTPVLIFNKFLMIYWLNKLHIYE